MMHSARKQRSKKTSTEAGRLLLKRALVMAALLGTAAFALIAFTLHDIQIVNNARFERIALANQLRHRTISPQRGAIFDINGNILAMSTITENLFLSPLELAEHEEYIPFIVVSLATILDIEFDFIHERALRYPSEFQVIKRNVNRDQAEQVRSFARNNGFRGIHFETSSMRHYPNYFLASHVIGFVGGENIGLEGIEQRYNRYLVGSSGREIRIRNARGADLHFSEFDYFFEAYDGYNITLTIDLHIQQSLERRLFQAIEDYDVQNGGVAIAMNVNTGAILGIANYPTFDPNNFLTLSESVVQQLELIEDMDLRERERTNALHRQWRNRALTDTYEPGSVFKVITMAMALEKGVATLYCYFFCSGSMEVRGRLDEDGRPVPIHCANRHGHGWQTLDEAMQNSCNIAFIELAHRVGARAFYHYIDGFGLFDRTGLDNMAESNSIWWDENVFFNPQNLSQLAAASFGQTFKITPIQMITALAATINGGYLMQPHFVHQITDVEGNIIRATEPTVIRQVISGETSEKIRRSLENVVISGTGVNAQVLGFRIGGKTGTSENIEQLTTYEDTIFKDYIVSFAGFAPADNPEVLVLLFLDTPSHHTGIFIAGGTMAAPVVGNIFSDILQLHIGVMPEFTEEVLRHINVQVPRAIGRYVNEAAYLLVNQGFYYRVIGNGELITAQLPAAHAMITPGATVLLFADEDPPRTPVHAPNLSGMTYEQARYELERRGLFIRTVGLMRLDSRARVSIQSVSPGESIPIGSVVEVTLIDGSAV